MINKNNLIFSNIYRSPNSTAEENKNLNDWFRSIGNNRLDEHLIVGDFNRKNINWDTVTSTSQDDCKFIEAIQDSYLTQHINSPTRGRISQEPSLIDLCFSTIPDAIQDMQVTSPIGKSDGEVGLTFCCYSLDVWCLI